MNNLKELSKVVATVRELRHPERGCPWDLKQTHKSLLKYLIEESYEFIYATEEDNIKNMEEELGDVLLQILLHTTIAEDKNQFSLESIAKILNDKLIRRHPHVFEDNKLSISSEDVVINWEKIKKEEKLLQKEKESNSLIDHSYLQFPALYSSYKIGKQSQKINFDWDNSEQVTKIVEEEWQEFKDELVIDKNSEKTREEFGDLLFSMAQLGRHLGFNPEDTLRDANKKFIKRFQKMEKKIVREKKEIRDMNQQEMDLYWDIVKNDERK